MQRILSKVQMLTSLASLQCRSFYLQQSLFSTFQRPAINEKLLTPFIPIATPACGFKVKGRVRRRCKSCYIVVREDRIYNICPKYPRHKQMSMKPKPLTTYILTHATQSRVRPW